MNYYNEIDKTAANWIRKLIKDGLIPNGDVDERSIVDVKPDELKSYDQCHFFAGIAGWSYALQLAGWPSNRPVWTGSCPCQPFSTAGKGLGQSDERHLWPVFFNLIRECRPQHVFGEQVASAIGHGWLDGVSADLESEGYACGATVLGAHSVGAPHIRKRLYWVANSDNQGPQGRIGSELRECPAELSARKGGACGGLGNASGSASEWDARSVPAAQEGEHAARVAVYGPEPVGPEHAGASMAPRPCPPDSPWRDADWLYCRDDRWRPVEPGTFPLAHGIPARMVRLRGYGNAIVPQVASEFVMAFMEIEQMNNHNR